MSGRYRLTLLARDDLTAIASYGMASWGPEAVAAYLVALDRRFQMVAQNPGLGPARPDIHPDVRALRHRQHVIVYRKTRDGVDIVAVPHVRMDMQGHLKS